MKKILFQETGDRFFIPKTVGVVCHLENSPAFVTIKENETHYYVEPVKNVEGACSIKVGEDVLYLEIIKNNTDFVKYESPTEVNELGIKPKIKISRQGYSITGGSVYYKTSGKMIKLDENNTSLNEFEIPVNKCIEGPNELIVNVVINKTKEVEFKISFIYTTKEKPSIKGVTFICSDFGKPYIVEIDAVGSFEDVCLKNENGILFQSPKTKRMMINQSKSFEGVLHLIRGGMTVASSVLNFPEKELKYSLVAGTITLDMDASFIESVTVNGSAVKGNSFKINYSSNNEIIIRDINGEEKKIII